MGSRSGSGVGVDLLPAFLVTAAGSLVVDAFALVVDAFALVVVAFFAVVVAVVVAFALVALTGGAAGVAGWVVADGCFSRELARVGWALGFVAIVALV